MVHRVAKEAQQNTQITTLNLALEAFKNDYGDYPPSDCSPPSFDYCGAQKFAEALVGWDLMGFHPKTVWRADGLDGPGAEPVYLDTEQNLMQRRGPYLENAGDTAFWLGKDSLHDGLFIETGSLNPDRFVICDVFRVKRVILPSGKTVKAGAPILYYRANTSSRNIDNEPADFVTRIYNAYDNQAILQIKEDEDMAKRPGALLPLNPLVSEDDEFQFFYDYIRDPKVTGKPWPYKPDSYILISAGPDGFYGTDDDITNFGN